jgi:hypothetical protein
LVQQKIEVLLKTALRLLKVLMHSECFMIKLIFVQSQLRLFSSLELTSCWLQSLVFLKLKMTGRKELSKFGGWNLILWLDQWLWFIVAGSN